MVLDQNVYFKNPKMPDWLHFGLMNAFKNKQKDYVNWYQKEWEDMLNG